MEMFKRRHALRLIRQLDLSLPQEDRKLQLELLRQRQEHRKLVQILLLCNVLLNAHLHRVQHVSPRVRSQVALRLRLKEAQVGVKDRDSLKSLKDKKQMQARIFESVLFYS